MQLMGLPPSPSAGAIEVQRELIRALQLSQNPDVFALAHSPLAGCSCKGCTEFIEHLCYTAPRDAADCRVLCPVELRVPSTPSPAARASGQIGRKALMKSEAGNPTCARALE